MMEDLLWFFIGGGVAFLLPLILKSIIYKKSKNNFEDNPSDLTKEKQHSNFIIRYYMLFFVVTIFALAVIAIIPCMLAFRGELLTNGRSVFFKIIFYFVVMVVSFFYSAKKKGFVWISGKETD